MVRCHTWHEPKNNYIMESWSENNSIHQKKDSNTVFSRGRSRSWLGNLSRVWWGIYEDVVAHEKLFETSTDLIENLVAIPTHVTAHTGVRCNVSVRMVNCQFSIGFNDGMSQRLTPCSADGKPRRGYRDLPFNDDEVIIPLYDKIDEIVFIKYVHIHNIF